MEQRVPKLNKVHICYQITKNWTLLSRRAFYFARTYVQKRIKESESDPIQIFHIHFGMRKPVFSGFHQEILKVASIVCATIAVQWAFLVVRKDYRP